MGRVLVILNLAALAVVLAAWPLSYWRGASIVQSGRGGMAIDTGALFFAGADVVATTGGWEFEFYHPEFPLESMEVKRFNRWLPIRVINIGKGRVLIITLWFVAVVMAVPAWLLWRRRTRRDAPRGFEVAVAPDGGNA